MDIQEKLTLHEKWLNGDPDGQKISFDNENLFGVDFSYRDLIEVSFKNAIMRDCKFVGANLTAANLQRAHFVRCNCYGANFDFANCQSANLQDATLTEATFHWANLSNANLNFTNCEKTDFKDANLTSADCMRMNAPLANFINSILVNTNFAHAVLDGAHFDKAKINHTNFYGTVAVPQCPEEGSFIAWKKAGNGQILIKLRIPADAERSSATSRKCRCSKAEVLSFEFLDGTPIDPEDMREVASDYNCHFIYELGKTVSVDNFNENRWLECASGIHFFLTREEAAYYER